MKKQTKKLSFNDIVKLFIVWSGMLLFLTLAVYLVKENATLFQASLIPTIQAPAYDGLTMPIEKAPNWVAMTADEYKMSYDQIPASKIQKIPVYEPSKLKLSTDTLKWGNPSDDAVRNMKITYSVPYMGNYKLDGTEYSGSHLAVDIKIPMNTPVYAIGNGVVVKTEELSSGFGNHIVIEHKNFPSFDNPNNKTTYFSTYNHLSKILVTENTVVKKGQLIGYSGNSGLSTTPHLHFQIDNSSAPWHPYWPFTSKEYTDAGLTFTSAINTGFNQSKALANTINPIMYIQKYQNATINTSITNTTQPDNNNNSTSTNTNNTTPSNTSNTTNTTETQNPVTETATETNTPVDNPEVNANTPTVEIDNNANEYITFDIEGDDTFEIGQEKLITITAKDRAGNIISNYAPSTPIRLDTLLGSVQFSQDRLYKGDFVNGVATVIMTPRNDNSIQFRVKSDTVMVDSKVMNTGVFVDISKIHPNFQAIAFLKSEGVIQGYPDGSFKPENNISRVEVLKLILEGIKADVTRAKSLPFTDTDLDSWYADYLAAANKLGIAEGYPDKTFRPQATVNKVEFLKMLVEAMNIDINPEVETIGFSDVDKDSWYAPYVQFAVEKKIIEIDGTKFNPTEKMDRASVAEAIYRVQLLTETGASQYAADLINQITNLPA